MAQAGTPHLTLADRLRIGLRVAAMALLLLACLPGTLIARARGRSHRAGTTRWPRRFLAGVSWIMGIRLSVTGQLGSGQRLILANHVSWLDIPALAAVTGSAFVAQDGLESVPLLNWLCRLADTIFVARFEPQSIAEQVAAVREGLVPGCTLTIFPEATTSDGKALWPFKSSLLSAFEGRVGPGAGERLTVQPVWLDFGAEAADIAWIGVEAGRDNFLRICARKHPMPLCVHLLEPLSGAALADRKAMAEAARNAILAAIAGAAPNR